MPRAKLPSPEELAERRQHEAELVVRRAYESRTPAQRLAALDAACPSQQRPMKKPCIWDRVDFMEWATWRSLGLRPPADEERFGNRLRKDERGQRRR
jgi:hypothetical protein